MAGEQLSYQDIAKRLFVKGLSATDVDTTEDVTDPAAGSGMLVKLTDGTSVVGIATSGPALRTVLGTNIGFTASLNAQSAGSTTGSTHDNAWYSFNPTMVVTCSAIPGTGTIIFEGACQSGEFFTLKTVDLSTDTFTAGQRKVYGRDTTLIPGSICVRFLRASIGTAIGSGTVTVRVGGG